jgi:hypothetical protein
MKRGKKRSLRLSESVDNAIQSRATELGVSWSDVVNEVLNSFFCPTIVRQNEGLTKLVGTEYNDTNKVSTNRVDTNLVHTNYNKKKGIDFNSPNDSEESYQQPWVSDQVKRAMPYGEEFARVWSAWLGVNRDKGMPIITTVQLTQLKKIVETCGDDEEKALALISFSIENNYKGLIYERFTGNSKGKGRGFDPISPGDFEQMVSELSTQRRSDTD